MLTKRTTLDRYRSHIAVYGEDDCGIYCDPCQRRWEAIDVTRERCPECGSPVSCIVSVDPHDVDLTVPDLAWLTEDELCRPEIKSPYLEAPEAAAYLKITVKALYGLVERRRLRPLPGHRRYRFTKDMLDAYLRGE